MTIETFKGGGMMITGKKDIELFGLLSLRKRLELEIKWPGFATRLTLQACRNRGFDGRTRKKALIWINEILRPFDERKNGPEDIASTWE